MASIICITVIAPVLEVSYEIDVTSDMLFRDLKSELAVLTGIPIEKQRLPRGCEDDKSLGSYDSQSLYLHHSDDVEIFVKTLTGRTITFRLPLDTTTVLSLQRRLELTEGLPPDQQRLIFGRQQLDTFWSNRSLSSYKIEEESTIQLVLKLRGGGPVDGYLAFAGVCREWDGKMYGETAGLSLSYKQVIIVCHKMDENWFHGRFPGERKVGVFPLSFVEILEYMDDDFMKEHRASAAEALSKDDDLAGLTCRTPPRSSEEVSRAGELKKKNELVTLKPGLALPPFKYPMFIKPEYKFPLPKSSFIHLRAACDSAIIPGNPINVGVTLSSHAHDAIFVSSIHLTIEARGSAVLDVRPLFETKSGKHIELDVQNTTSTENSIQLSGKVGVAQMVTGEIGVTKEWKTGSALQLGGKEIIPAQVSGQVLEKNAFWNIQAEITPSRLRGFSGPVWNGLLFVLDRHSTRLEYRLTVNCRIQGEAKDRIIKGKCWWKGYL